MTRERILRDIADLDGQINSILGQTRIPGVDVKPFPKGSWILAIISFGWYLFGSEAPETAAHHAKYGDWGLYFGLFFALFAVIGSLSWLFRRRGGSSPEYREATDKVKVLQERRRELQMQLKEIEEG